MQDPRQPVYSPDGRFLWDGHQWVPLAHSAGPMPGARRSPVLHFFASFILVGLGTIFAGRLVKGLVLFFLGNGCLISATVLSVSLAHACDLTVVGGRPGMCAPGYPATAVVISTGTLAVTGVLLWLYGLFDAVASTRERNQEHGWPR
jgi:hypothetical protein